MTSNCGVENLSKTATIGFSAADSDMKNEEALIMQGLRKRFKPEFINRIDNIVVFNSLTQDNIKKITALLINGLTLKLEAAGIKLHIEHPVIDYLAKKGGASEYGARPIKRLIQTELEDPIAEAMLSESSKTNCRVSLEDERIKICLK